MHTGGMDLDTRAWLQERIDGRIAAGIGIAWLVAYQVAASLEPVTHQREPWYGVALGVTFMALLAGTAAGLIAQRRWGLVASLAAAGFFTALSVACPVSGHHAFGTWWFGQMACALTMLGGSVAALAWSSRVEDADDDDPTGSTGAEPADSAFVSAGDGASPG